MPINYSIDRAREVILEVWEGEITREELSSYWQDYLSDPDVMALRKTVVDLRMARIKFRATDLMDLLQRIVLPKLNGLEWQSAIVVHQPDQQALSYTYQVLAESYSRDAVFYDVDTAVAWLTKLGDKT